MNDGTGERSRVQMLRKLRRRKFSGVYFAPADALVAYAPGSGDPAPAVLAKLKLHYDHRVYPSEAGYLIKWPYQGEEFDPRHFRLETGGWDHEHCVACNASIHAKEECWFTKRGSTYILCGACYDRLEELGGA